MQLSDVKKGDFFKIKALPKGDIRSQATRLGMSVDASFSCYEIIKDGPVVIKNSNQQIAVGRRLAKDITVEILIAR